MNSLYEYPRRRVGVGLLLLRASLGMLLANNVFTFSSTLAHLQGDFLLALAVGICVGLFIPVLSLIALFLELSIAIGCGRASSLDSVVSIGLCLATAMLGAGGYSIDGLLFGRRRVLV